MLVTRKNITFLVIILLEVMAIHGQEAHRDVKHPELPKLVRNWAEKLGGELWHFGELVTRRNTVVESFRHTQVVQEDGTLLLKEITEKIKKMMDEKVEAVKRIMEIAENVAAAQSDDVEESFTYVNAKDLENSAAPNEDEENGEEEGNSHQAESLRETYSRYVPDQKYTSDGIYRRKSSREESEDYQSDQEQIEEQEQIIVEDKLETEEKEEEFEVRFQGEKVKYVTSFPEWEVLPALRIFIAVRNDGFSKLKKEVESDNENEPMASPKTDEDKRRLALYPNPHFYNIPVNTNVSAVHVPSNVYDRSKEVIKGIKWSEELDKIFRNNYKNDPTLSWQYFGASTGFMRQFPAMIWHQEPVDLFDCRTRNWYIEAASSPKDIVILIDRSGSMTGMRREIAKHVVYNILDTLGNNDFVNIYTFSNTTEPLIDCFDDLLVQANLANVRMFKEAMALFHTEQIANFSLALTTAFKLLKDYRDNRIGEGAQCNQAIMLVTDGVYYNFKEIFKEYNWQNLPFMPVRVFTYLIGREVSDVREVKWMACANQGYYVHLSTYAEVREQVLHYIPVMARPMVLNPTLKPNPTWSPVYADVTDPKLTNWLWTNRVRNKQRDRFMLYWRNRNRTMFLTDDNMDKKFVYQQKKKREEMGEMQVYRMMTSVSLPVYDRRQNATRVANLLGVAGTDVPIEYIQRLMLPYKVGVNGYAAIVTNNGYLLIHPDLRPVFEGILKPAYNRVDIMEAELLDDDTDPREFSDELQDFRKAIVNQTAGQKVFRVKTHLDNMNRIMFEKRHYFFMGIARTPFTVVLALPDRYGFHRINHPIEDDPHRMRSNNKNLTQFFTGNWTIHPDWHYCRYLDDRHNFSSVEEEFMHFVHKIEGPGWKWTGECDRKLTCKVIADAKITEWFNKNISATSKEENGDQFIKRFGITVAFLATHSGLTRWQDFPQNTGDRETKNEPHFHSMHNRAIDEVWYRRAVEQHYIQPRSFVYSVPFGAGYEDNEDDVLVTASHAIFKEDKGKKAPAAVVGFQFYHSALHALFQKITSTCGEITCKRTCSSEELYCLVLDDNGYVVVSHDRQRTGFFLGDFRPDIMELLVEEGVYNRTRMYDYQSTCFPTIITGSPATTFRNPLAHFKGIIGWLAATVFYFVNAVVAQQDCPVMMPNKNEEDEEYKFFPCDKLFYVYTLLSDNLSAEKDVSYESISYSLIPQSNLLLLAYEPSIYLNLTTPTRCVDIDYGERVECIIARANFSRRHHLSCFNQNEYFNPLSHLAELIQWAVGTIFYFIQATLANESDDMMFAMDDMGDEDDPNNDIPASRAFEKDFDQRLLLNKTQPEPCDAEFYLYSLVHYTERNISNSGYNKTMTGNCSRPFLVQPVVGSNMVLLVVNMLCPEVQLEEPLLSPDPTEITYLNMSRQCYIVHYNNFPRRNYMSCINRSIHEAEIELCGKGANINGKFSILSLIILVLLTATFST